jgi:predicted nucleotidyltransferase
MTLDELRQSRREKILKIAAHYGASNIRVFGSVARGESRASSDVDLLVDLEQGRSLMDLGGLLMELQEELQVRIDLATERMLRPGVRERALAEAVPL